METQTIPDVEVVRAQEAKIMEDNLRTFEQPNLAGYAASVEIGSTS